MIIPILSFYFSSRVTIYTSISRVISRTEKIQKNSTTKNAKNPNWIEKTLKEGKWEQVRDISPKKTSPAAATDPETEMTISPLSPKRPLEQELGRYKRIRIPNPKYNNDPSNPENVYVMPSALNFDDLGLGDDDDNDRNFEIGKKKPKPQKKRKVRLAETVQIGERIGLSDSHIAMMYNAGNK